MKKISFFIMLFAIAFSFTACSNRMGNDRGSTSGGRTSTGGGTTGEETGGNVGSSSEMNMRAEFVRDAADGGMSEVQLANIAKQKASSQAVKDFAQMMIDDHSKANDELKDLATTENLTVPSSISSDNQSEIDKLSKLSGTEFDQEYMDFMVDDHKKDVDKFEEASKNITDPQLKAWVDKTLPTLRHHLDMAKTTRDQVKNNK
ncbi:MAG: DUF4142 domain-containing protein [Syntrophothermus sp.]